MIDMHSIKDCLGVEEILELLDCVSNNPKKLINDIESFLEKYAEKHNICPDCLIQNGSMVELEIETGYGEPLDVRGSLALVQEQEHCCPECGWSE
jgi:hypothetical protein